MKHQAPWQTLLFTLSVLAVLGLLSGLPESLRAPGLKWPTPFWEKALAAEDAALKVLPEGDTLEADALRSPIKPGQGGLEFAEGDTLGLAKFARALRSADQRVVRVLHYGDSQIEGDRISADLRGMLQEAYGGMGPGLQGLDPFVPMASVDHRASGNWRRYACFGSPSDREPTEHYGVRGIAHRYEGGTASVEFRARSYGYERVRKGQRLTLMLGGYEAPVEVKVYFEDSLAHIRYYGAEDAPFMQFTAPKPMDRVRVEFKGESPLCYGASWDGLRGVAVDNISMRGADGLGFRRINQTHFQEELQRVNPGLVILQYGGNAVPYFKSSAEVASYGRAFARQIAAIQRAVPDADILVVGPSDMAHKTGVEWESYPFVAEVRDALRAAAHLQGAAFFDVYAFMGGSGSMADWVQRDPPLAGADHIHFTPNGARKVGRALAKALELELQRHPRD